MKQLLTTFIFATLFAFTAFAATVNPTQATNAGKTESVNAQWTPLVGTADTAAALKTANYLTKSVQVVGTFSGATVAIQGSNDGSNWVQLTDQANAALTCTAACLKTIQQSPLYVRPVVTGTVSAASLTVLLHLKPN